MNYKYDRDELMEWLGLTEQAHSHVCLQALMSAMAEQIHSEDYITLSGIKGEWVCKVIWAHHDGDITETEVVANTVYKAVVQCFHKHLWDLRRFKNEDPAPVSIRIRGLV